MTMKKQIAVLSFAALAAAGCKPSVLPCTPVAPPPPAPTFEYVRVDYQGQRSIGGESPAEISDTPAYRKALPTWKTVALRVPNTCLTDTAARVQGNQTGRLILTTQCGIWLKELESALSNSGYRVISWDALHRAESAGDMSTYSAAAKLGADVVFLINSLESNPTNLKDSGKMVLSYSRSNAAGDKLAPAALDENRRSWLKAFVGDRTDHKKREAQGVQAHAATLDLTAVSATGGESVWFYRRSLTRLAEEVLRSAERMSFLFAYEPNKIEWWPVTPAGLLAQAAVAIPPAPMLSSEDVVDTSADNVGPQDQDRAIELELVRIIVKDFVANFKAGDKPAG